MHNRSGNIYYVEYVHLYPQWLALVECARPVWGPRGWMLFVRKRIFIFEYITRRGSKINMPVPVFGFECSFHAFYIKGHGFGHCLRQILWERLPAKDCLPAS